MAFFYHRYPVSLLISRLGQISAPSSGAIFKASGRGEAEAGGALDWRVYKK